MHLERDNIACFRLPASQAPARTTEAIPAARFPLRIKVFRFFVNRRFGQPMRIFRDKIHPAAEKDMQIFRKRPVFGYPRIDNFVLFREREKFRSGDQLCRFYHLPEICAVQNIAADMKAEILIGKRRPAQLLPIVPRREHCKRGIPCICIARAGA